MTDEPPITADIMRLIRETLARRAAVIAWCIGIIELVIFSLLALACLRLGAMSVDEFIDFAASTNQGVDQLKAWHELMPRMAMATGICGILPGILYTACGFAIRHGSRTGAALVLMLAGMQIVVLGAILSLLIARSFQAGDPPTMTLAVLILGTPMAVLVMLSRAVWPMVQARWEGTKGRRNEGTEGEEA
ncbi:MAG: hypothetical protein WD768_06055 [Phycisphaeraceae bacterium]